jgi:predicted RND superfamily exporter protein
MLDRYIRFIVAHPVAVVLLSVAAALALASGARKLEFTSDYRIFFSPQNPQLVAFETLQNTYTKNDNVLFVLTPQDGDVFTPRTLAAIEWLTKEAWQIPYSIRVDSISNFQHTRAAGDDLIVRDLVRDAPALTPEALAGIRKVALSEPLLVRRLIAPSGDVTGINVTIQLPGDKDHEAVPKVAAYARQLAEQFTGRFPDVAVRLTGVSMMNNAFSESAQRDTMTLVPVMFGVVILTIAVLIRVVSGTAAAVGVIALSIASAMGIAGFLGIPLSPPSVNAPTIILTLAVADSVHILVSYLFALRHGKDKAAAMTESLRLNFYPVFLTSFTTAVGFLGMNFSEAPPFRDLGNMVSIGVLTAWALSVTFLPAVTLLLPVRVRVGKTAGHERMERFAAWVIRRRAALLWGTVGVTALLAASIPRNELNDQFVEYFDESVAFRRDTDYASERLTGPYTIDYSLRADGPESVSDPAFLAKIERFADWYRAQPEVLHVNSITDIMKRLNKNLHGDDPAYYRIPETRSLAAQYLLLYEMSLPYGLDLNNQLNVDKSATRLVVSLRNLSSNELLALERRARDWLAANAPELQTQGASPAIMFAHIGKRNIQSMLIGNLVALVVISLSLVVVFRTFRIGITSMVPNLVPIAMAFGLWGIFVGQVGLGLSVVTSMTMGIVVDDTIHFLSKYLHARRVAGKTPEEAIVYAFSTVGTALWVLSLVLVAGFLVLAMSHFKLSSDMGIMTATTFALGMFVEFLFLPPLLLWLDREPRLATAGRPVAAPAAQSAE